MNKIIATKNSGFVHYNPETEDIRSLDTDRDAVNRVLLVNEECDFCIDDKKMHVVPGDIVITFWEKMYPNRAIVVKSEEWKENILKYREYEEKQKEAWALKQKNECSKCDNTCDNACDEVSC